MRAKLNISRFVELQESFGIRKQTGLGRGEIPCLNNLKDSTPAKFGQAAQLELYCFPWLMNW